MIITTMAASTSNGSQQLKNIASIVTGEILNNNSTITITTTDDNDVITTQ